MVRHMHLITLNNLSRSKALEFFILIRFLESGDYSFMG